MATQKGKNPKATISPKKKRKKNVALARRKTIKLLKIEFLEYYKDLPIQKLAADHIGKSEDTISIWKKKDKIFSDDIARARSDWAKTNTSFVKNKEWLLERVMKDQFAQKKEISIDSSEKLDLTLERIAKLLP